jgi:RES domain-containing protein
MKPKAYANYEGIKAALSSLASSSRPWSGVCYRVTSVRYAKAHDFLSGQGSLLYGGRFIAPGVAEVLHLSASPELSLSESLARRRRYGIAEWEAMPLLIRGVDVRLKKVLFLSESAAQTALSVTEGDLCAPGWEEANEHGEEALTQALGRAAFELSLEGLLVPSATAPGENLVIFITNVGPDSALRSLG